MKRVGLVGFGMIAENAYIPALRELGVELAAVADASASRREAAARAVNPRKIYTGHQELLDAEKNLDALIVATPPLYHADAVLAGLRADLHVLCEKPLTLDSSALKNIADESLRHKRAVYTVNNWSYSPQWSTFIRIASTELGAIRHAEIRVLRTQPSISALPGDWRRDPAISGGGILLDHGWHNLYLMRRLLGPDLELAQTLLHPSGRVDEVADIRLKSPIATGTIYMTWRANVRANTALVEGQAGTAELLDDHVTIKSAFGSRTINFPEKLSAGSAHPEWLAAMWPSFEAEIAGKNRGDNLAEASFCLGIIRKAYGVAREAQHA